MTKNSRVLRFSFLEKSMRLKYGFWKNGAAMWLIFSKSVFFKIYYRKSDFFEALNLIFLLVELDLKGNLYEKLKIKCSDNENN